MTEFKPGDRVKVEFEGVLVRKVHTATAHAWEIKVGSRISTVLVSEVECTLIEPEIVLPEVPGTIVLINGIDQEFFCYRLWVDGDWYANDGPEISSEDLLTEMREYGYRVIEAVTS